MQREGGANMLVQLNLGCRCMLFASTLLYNLPEALCPPRLAAHCALAHLPSAQLGPSGCRSCSFLHMFMQLRPGQFRNAPPHTYLYLGFNRLGWHELACHMLGLLDPAAGSRICITLHDFIPV